MTPLIPLTLASDTASPGAVNRLSTTLLSSDGSMHRHSLQPWSMAATSTPWALASRGAARPRSLPSIWSPSSQQSPVAPLCILPATAADWKATLSEIKRACVNKKYKQCSDRCLEILNKAKDLDKVQPAYLVYLHFYLATALEMQALAAHNSSPRRLSLLQQARSHYLTASGSAQLADETMSSPSLSRRFSSLSSMHSPAGSDVSSAASTRLSSPPPSLCSSSAPKSKPKKRVSFRDMPFTEPAIRPDSPTLGSDDYFALPSSPVTLYPESILKHTPLSPLHPQPPRQDMGQLPDPFFHARSIHRYCTLLSGLRSSIASHLAKIDAQIAAMEAPKAVPKTVSQDQSCNNNALSITTCTHIERLRANGWRRPRFDPSRYEKLRRDALADLAE